MPWYVYSFALALSHFFTVFTSVLIWMWSIPASKGIPPLNCTKYCQLLTECPCQSKPSTVTHFSHFLICFPLPLIFFAWASLLFYTYISYLMYVLVLALNNRIIDIWFRWECLSSNTRLIQSKSNLWDKSGLLPVAISFLAL